MKRKTSEINVFSMSALDLFASALGAFILLAVIFMPFFPNTGDHPKISEAIKEKVITLEKQLDTTQSSLTKEKAKNGSLSAELDKLKNAPKVQFPPVDMIIVLDTTSSMTDEISGLQKEISQFADLMVKMTPSFGLGIVEFKDRCEPTLKLRKFDILPMNASNLSQAQSFVDAMSAGGQACNGDNPENMAEAIDVAVGMKLRSDTDIKLIVVISDNPPYPELESSVLSKGQAFNNRGDGYRFSTVSTGSDGDQFLEKLANVGGGQFVSGSRSFSITMLLALAE